MKTYKDKVSGETLYVVSHQGITRYYKDKSMTVLHRLDGPAIEYANGRKVWYVNGKLHRLNGPAVEGEDEGEDVGKAWYVNGVIITSMYSSGRYEGTRLLQNVLNKFKNK